MTDAYRSTRTCQLCGRSSDVAPAVARYPDGFQSIDRCRDSLRCRDTVEASGKPWPLVGSERLFREGVA